MSAHASSVNLLATVEVRTSWTPLTVVYPVDCRTVELYRVGDLYPVVGWYAGPDEDGDCWMLEEGGPEDGEHRQYPRLAFAPTHWRDLDTRALPGGAP
jgi:hypothetical protein